MGPSSLQSIYIHTYIHTYIPTSRHSWVICSQRLRQANPKKDSVQTRKTAGIKAIYFPIDQVSDISLFIRHDYGNPSLPPVQSHTALYFLPITCDLGVSHRMTNLLVGLSDVSSQQTYSRHWSYGLGIRECVTCAYQGMTRTLARFLHYYMHIEWTWTRTDFTPSRGKLTVLHSTYSYENISRYD